MLFQASYLLPCHCCLRQLRTFLLNINCILLTNRTVFHTLFECFVCRLAHARLSTSTTDQLAKHPKPRSIRRLADWLLPRSVAAASSPSYQTNIICQTRRNTYTRSSRNLRKKRAVPIQGLHVIRVAKGQRLRFPNTNVGIMRRRR
jgi:hypothetical protein